MFPARIAPEKSRFSRYFVPNSRSPASPSPGTMYPCSLSRSSIDAVYTGTSGCAVWNVLMPSGQVSRHTNLIDRGDRRVAGRQHRIDDDAVAVAHLARDLEVVLDGEQRLGVAVQADVPDARRRQDLEHAVEDAVAGAEDRDQHDLLAVEHRRLDRRDRRLDLGHRRRQVAAHLVREQHADLAQEVAEVAGAGV